jgi:hypothetical protein
LHASEVKSMRQDVQHLEKRLLLGVVSLGVGLFAANLALFNWIERTGLSYLLANYARYVCAYGGFGAMIFGAMLVNDFLVRRKPLKKRDSEDELKMFVDVRKKKVTQPVDRRSRKQVSKTLRKV